MRGGWRVVCRDKLPHLDGTRGICDPVSGNKSWGGSVHGPIVAGYNASESEKK